MGKQRHLDPSQLLLNAQLSAYIEREVRQRMEATTMSERVVNAIRATHTADNILDLTVLLDYYDADAEWCKQFLDAKNELMHQYNDGTVQLKQLKEHIKIRCGIDVDEITDREMKEADIKASEAETA